MDKLTYDELITIVIALDNEAARSEAAATLRDLKWKVFRIAVDVKRNESGDWRERTGHDCTNGGTEDWCDDCNPYLQ